jgi:hypothetical protein
MQYSQDRTPWDKRKMVYPVDLRMLHAMARHDPAGRPKDPHDHHRHDLIRQHRAARKKALLGVLRKAARMLRGLAPKPPPARTSIRIAKPQGSVEESTLPLIQNGFVDALSR